MIRSKFQLVTLADLEKFRVTLMMDIKSMLEGSLDKPAKRWLKFQEVRKLLNILYGTLQSGGSKLLIQSSRENVRSFLKTIKSAIKEMAS